jgi:hypothetical protein
VIGREVNKGLLKVCDYLLHQKPQREIEKDFPRVSRLLVVLRISWVL